jgi:hypothetical protein
VRVNIMAKRGLTGLRLGTDSRRMRGGQFGGVDPTSAEVEDDPWVPHSEAARTHAQRRTQTRSLG